MKLLFVTLLAIVAMATSEKCEPNSVFKLDCNTCHCSPDGKTAACTLMACNSDPVIVTENTDKSGSTDEEETKESGEICEPGATFKYYCNTCKCADDGKSKICTYMYCDEAVWNKDGTLKIEDSSEESSDEESKQVCEPGTAFLDYCNSCRCSNDGKSAACTLMACDPSVWNKDGSRKTQPIIKALKIAENEVDCEPHKSFKYYCNTCTCTANGRMGGCTLMYCDPAVWNRDGTLKTVEPVEPKQYCEPDTTFNDYCNTCHCSKDGKTAACTLMACNPAVWNKDGTRKIIEAAEPKQYCEPGTTFKEYCNTCLCTKDGKAAACTLMYCDPAVWNKDGTRKIIEAAEPKQYCQPGTTFKDYCNTCHCSKDGKMAACTLMACDTRLWNKDGTRKISPNFIESDESKN